MASAVRVRGLREFQRDLGRMDKGLRSGLQKELRKVGEPVAADARSKASGHGWSSPTVAGFRVGTRRGGVVVRQRKGRTSGKRPDFGALQMELALIPALEENADEIVSGVEDFLDRLTGAGFGGII